MYTVRKKLLPICTIKTLNEFIAFRKKYMNFQVDKQIADLKRVGIVKKVNLQKMI